LFCDPDRRINASSFFLNFQAINVMKGLIFATVSTFLFPGRDLSLTSYSSRIKSQNVRKLRSEAFNQLRLLPLWSAKTIIG
jgi:hypothetical protein